VARRRRRIRVKKGALHRQLGIRKGRKIPVSTLRRLKRSKSALTRKRATFALNARKWRKGRRRRK